jgi:hypothetical protein
MASEPTYLPGGLQPHAQTAARSMGSHRDDKLELQERQVNDFQLTLSHENLQAKFTRVSKSSFT